MTTWKKSSHSGTSNCVEVAQDQGVVRVRDSKDPGGPVLVFTAEEWAAFLARVTGSQDTRRMPCASRRAAASQ